jgi:RHS repeat-associated protein
LGGDPQGPPIPLQRFQYDGVGRLVDGQVRRQGQASLSREQIAYDAFGNWTSRAVNSVGIPVPQVNPATNRFTGDGVNYDGSGNLLQWSLTSPQLKFDLLDRVIERKDGPTTWQYLYTASGERVIEKNAATGLERWTLRGPDNQVLRTMERQPSGQWSVLRDNLFAGRRLLAAHSPAGLHHFHLDHLGSVRLETDAAGNPIKYRDFLPFGESLETGGGTENRLLYTGHQRDDMATPTTADDLDYMHARYCSPTFGRFLSVDPVLGSAAAPQSWNRYAYVRGNPVTLVDRNGEHPAAVVVVVAAVETGFTAYDTYDTVTTLLDPQESGFNKILSSGGFVLGVVAPGGGYGKISKILLSRIEKVPLTGRLIKSRKVELPTLDRTKKVHGELPAFPPKNANREELEGFAADLKTSIETRKREQLDLGEDGPHRERIRQEEQLLRQLEKFLEGS